jgi:soluble cytochrome b562
MTSLIFMVRQPWYKQAIKHDKPHDDDAFETYINSMTPLELLQEISGCLDAMGVTMTISRTTGAKYWFIKSLSKLQKALKQQNVLSQKHSNELVEEIGVMQPNNVKGIPKDSPEMKQYTEAMEAFMEETVEIDIKKLSLGDLAANQVSLTVNDQIALEWLIDEDGPVLTVVK